MTIFSKNRERCRLLQLSFKVQVPVLTFFLNMNMSFTINRHFNEML